MPIAIYPEINKEDGMAFEPWPLMGVILLPDKPSLLAFFGGHGNNKHTLISLWRSSPCLYDVCLDLPIDAQLDRKQASERELAMTPP